MSESMITTIRPSNMKRGAAAAAILLLMLSSQIAGTAGNAKIEAQQTTSQPPSQSPPVAPPRASALGEISYTNTWNRTSAQQQPSSICLQANAAIQSPLKQESQSWVLASNVP